jgi:ATP-binding cassette subfamily B protein
MPAQNWLALVNRPKFRTKESFSYLLGYFAAYRFHLLAGAICLFLANVLGLLAPTILRFTIDGLMANVGRSRLVEFGGLILLVALARATMLFFQRRLLIGVARDVEYRLRNDFYSHLQKLPTDFYQTRRTGDLMARATSDMGAIRMVGGLGLITTLNALFAVIMVLPTMIFINWRLTALAFLPLPMVAVLAQRFSKQIHERARRVQESYGRLSSNAQEMPTGVRVARAYNLEEFEINKFRESNRDYVMNNIALIHLSSAFRPILQFFVGLGFIIVFSYGGYLVIKGVLTTGQFVQQTFYLGFIVGPVASFGSTANLYQRAMASMGRIHDILSIKPTIRDEKPICDHTIHGEIEFRDLTFKYRNGAAPALKHIDLKIATGQMVAFVGAVGSGKSTLMNLVCRLNDPPRGQLLIDGQPVQDIPLRTLRSGIGYVPQETVLFSDTIAANIAFGRKDCSRELVEAAAAQAVVADDIRKFPRGFETRVGERGLTLSGGQKQRTAIARALSLGPSILILDDALSAVDAQTEEQILKNLRHAAGSRTTLVVTHRLSTIENADLIVMLAEGWIVERGTHEELIAAGGQYAALYEKQRLEDDLATN